MRIQTGLAATMTALLLTAPGPLAAQPPADPGSPAPAAAAPPPAAPAAAQSSPPSASPPPVQVQTLAQLDLFSAGRDAGLGSDLWKGSSADVARAVLPTLGQTPLSPAARALAVRLLAQAATAPDGAGADADLAAARAWALLAMGNAGAVDSILDRTPNLAESAGLSRAAAEAALITDQNPKACAISDALAVSRDQVYWLRLRAFCQALAGKTDAAQLTFTLANQEGRDPIYARLMGAFIAGVGDPGAPALRNGLDYALSRQLKLDLEPVLSTASPAVAAHLAASIPPPPPPPPPPPGAPAAAPPPAGSEADLLAVLRKADTPAAFTAAAKTVAPGIALLAQAKTPLAQPVQLATAAIAAGDLATAQTVRAGLVQDSIPGAGPVDLAILDALLAVAAGKPDAPTLDRLAERGAKADGKDQARAQAATALFEALGGPSGGAARAELASFDLGRTEASPARLLALNAAADAGLRGETGLLALTLAAPGGATGPRTADRAWIIRALARSGLSGDAAAFAVEGLIALQSR